MQPAYAALHAAGSRCSEEPLIRGGMPWSCKPAGWTAEVAAAKPAAGDALLSAASSKRGFRCPPVSPPSMQAACIIDWQCVRMRD